MGLDTAYYIYLKQASYKNLKIEKYRDYIQRKLNYPDEAIVNGIYGRVVVKIEVDIDGSIKSEIVRSPRTIIF